MLSVYNSYHQTVIYVQQRNHILLDLTGLEIQISMKACKTENWFQTGFQQQKSGLPEKPVLVRVDGPISFLCKTGFVVVIVNLFSSKIIKAAHGWSSTTCVKSLIVGVYPMSGTI